MTNRYLDAMDFVALWNGFWDWTNKNQLATTVIGGLILASIFGAWARLPKLGKPIRALGTVRLTTTKRLADARKTNERKGFALGVEKTNVLVAAAHAERDEAREELTAARARPANQPRWQVEAFKGGGADEYVLRNVVPDPDLLMENVSLEAPGDEFTFTGVIQNMPRIVDTQATNFAGKRHTKRAIPFTISWNDETGIRRDQVTYLPRQEQKAFVFY
jgi:hypothetical protein